MARGRGKFFTLWLLICAAALYQPFQHFLASRNYNSAEEFFEDLLVWTVIVGVLTVPILLLVILRSKKRAKKLDSAPL